VLPEGRSYPFSTIRVARYRANATPDEQSGEVCNSVNRIKRRFDLSQHIQKSTLTLLVRDPERHAVNARAACGIAESRVPMLKLERALAGYAVVNAVL
jgi:hypothetical protein